MMRSTSSLLIVAVAALAPAFAPAAPALAQDADSAETTDAGAAKKTSRVTQLNKLVVGAGVDKVAIDTPQSVTVLEQSDIDSVQADSIGELFGNVPGVNTAGSASALGQAFNIRGIGATESASDQNRIITTVDGVGKYYESYRMGSFFSDPELYKRVEVLRGAASSTLYGAGALGGVINFTTKDAGDFLADGQTKAVRLKESYTSNGDGFTGSALVALRPSESEEYLLYGNYRKLGNYHAPGDLEIKGSGSEAPSALAKATYHFGEGNEQALKLSFQNWRSFGNDQNYAQTSSTSSFGTVDRTVTDQTFIAAYENPVSDSDWLDLKSQFSISDITNAQSDAKTSTGKPWDTTRFPMFEDVTYGYKTLSWDLSNTASSSGERFDNHLTTGLQLSHQTRSVLGEQQLNFHPGGTDAKAGIYVQDEFVWDDKLTLIPGLRADYHRLTPGEGIGDLSKSSEVAYSPKLAALYQINDMFGIFGSVAHTERLPSLDEVYSSYYPNYPDDMTEAYSLDLKKEKAFSQEIGFTASAYDLAADGDALSLKTTFFRNDISDMIQREDIGSNSRFVNIGKARTEGVEVELSYDQDHVFAQAGYSLVRGSNRSDGGGLNSVAPDEFSFTLGGRVPDRGVSFGWRGRLVAEQDRVAKGSTARDATPGFSVHGIFIDWTPEEGVLKGMSAQFAVENLFDRKYREFLANDYAYGRTFKVSLVQNF